ncbi:hypothetical protein D3C85_1931730 [compost metagenome]
MVADLLHVILRLVEQQRFQHNVHLCFGEHGDVLSDFFVDCRVNVVIFREALSRRKVK